MLDHIESGSQICKKQAIHLLGFSLWGEMLLLCTEFVYLNKISNLAILNIIFCFIMKKILLLSTIFCALLTISVTAGSRSPENSNRKELKKMLYEQDLDSMIVNQNFKFEPSTLYPQGSAPVQEVSRSSYLSVSNGWLISYLPHNKLNTNNFEFTERVKAGGMWTFTLRADNISEVRTMQFSVVANTGEARVRITSNRWGDIYEFTGYVTSN